MEVITFDSEAFKDLSDKIDKIAQYIEYKRAKTAKKLIDGIDEDWLDNFEVAEILRISTKTLQRLRKDNLISYSLLRGKCYYRISDIEIALRERIIRCSPQTIEDFRQSYLLKIKPKQK